MNAPHIPVHLGAMGEAVRRILADHPELAPGDVFVTNDPYRGGSHLPDVTVITPVFNSFDARRSGLWPDAREVDVAAAPDVAMGRLARQHVSANPPSPQPSPRGRGSALATPQFVFFTASRAHHAEIGGIAPGSMPPFSKNLAEEGVLIRDFQLIAAGQSRMDALAELLAAGPNPSRAIADNLADIAAQVAANRQGAMQLLALIDEQGWPLVSAYMRHIQTAAEQKLRQALAKFPPGRREFEDHLDDGAIIRVALTIESPGAMPLT